METVDAYPPVAEHSPRERRRPPTTRENAAGQEVGPARRLSSAGRALVISVLALLLGALLNAPGLHKTAETLNPGWKRNVGLALTSPLVSVSHGLLLDRPREEVKAALGRSGDDKIVTKVDVPPALPAGAPPPKPIREAFSPKHKLHYYIGGDSLVIVPGYSLQRATAGYKVYKAVGDVDGHVATGLERPDVFNWFEQIKQVMHKDKPNLVVLGIGGNDDHDYMTGLPQGASIGPFGSPSWIREYRRRVGGVMDTVIRGGGFSVWIGLPITSDAAQTQRFDLINRIYSEEARKRPRGAAYIDTYYFFADPKTGGFAQYLPDSSGQLIEMRAPDGVHFAPAGGDLIARQILKKLNERFDLTSWKRRSGSASSP
ncbi:MAG: hypothetical protein C5B48_01990 [Candidatus Rokuibacteriota bacterium]|nr:MAG: hypothetical protein C5B48_01990 [Candidatus Rokubacteria bacterium]